MTEKKMRTLGKKVMVLAAGLAFVSAAKSQIGIDNANSALSKKNKDTLVGWIKGGTFSFTFSEAASNTYYYQVKGGQKSALGIKAIVDYAFDKHSTNSIWYNSIRARYGAATSVDASGNNVFLKNDDYLNYTTIFAKPIDKKWSYAGFFSFESQFQDYFMTPGYFKLGPAIMFNPNTHFSLVMSPLMANMNTKLSSTLRDTTLYDVPAGKTVSFGAGAFVQAKLNYDLGKGVNYKSVVTISNDYFHTPSSVIFDWTNLFTFVVNKYIGATVSANLRYNDFEVKHMQFQQGLGIGLNYKLR
jgi:hypothetical protein